MNTQVASDKIEANIQPSLPKMTAWLTVNHACNLRCNWCYAKMTGFNSEDNMSMEIAEKSISLLKDLSLESVILIGGEPTIHPNFFEIVRMITAKRMNPYLVSNALKFSDEKFLKDTLDAGIRSITISLKASNACDYKKFTGRDVFGEVMKAVDNIGRSGIPHVINVTVCEDLINNFDEMMEIIDKSGTRTFSIDTGKPIILDDKTHVKGMGTPKQMAEFFMRIYPKMRRMKVRSSVKVAIPLCLFPKDFVDELIEDGNILTGCQMVRGRGIIFSPSGDLVPCNHMCNLSMGKIGREFIDRESFISFRRSKEVKDFYKKVSLCPHENCVDCSYWTICGAGCKLYWLHYGSRDLIGNFNRKEV